MTQVMPLTSYEVTLTAFTQLSDIEREWQALAIHAEANCFLCWPWIATWLTSTTHKAIIVRVNQNNTLVAMGLLNDATEKALTGASKKVAYLHQVGIQHFDDIWVEYNGLLALPEHKHQAQLACFNYVLAQESPWDELHISGACQNEVAPLLSQTNFYHATTWDCPSYRVNLKSLRDKSHSGYVSTLSRNTRYQINKATKAATQLNIDKANSLEEALAYFDACAQWHIAKWGKGPEGSGFCNPHFVSFHKTLIKQLFSQNAVHLWRVRVGKSTVTYLYNLIDKLTVFFYLSAIDYGQHQLNKPGLVAHTQVIQWYVDNGYNVYDFMGGDAQYKRSLADRGPDLIGIKLMRKTLSASLETLGRQLKRTLPIT